MSVEIDEAAERERFEQWAAENYIANPPDAAWLGWEGRAYEAAAYTQGSGDDLAKVTTERDDALSRIEELESYGERVATEFEGDCWKALRSLLDECKFDWRDSDPDGVTASCAREYIETTIREMDAGETKHRERAQVFEAEAAKLREALGEARSFIAGTDDGDRFYILSKIDAAFNPGDDNG